MTFEEWCNASCSEEQTNLEYANLFIDRYFYFISKSRIINKWEIKQLKTKIFKSTHRSKILRMIYELR
jgi:hypothetical protein